MIKKIKIDIDTNMVLNAGIGIFLVATLFALLHYKPMIVVFLWAVFLVLFFIRMARVDKKEIIEKQFKKFLELKDAFEAGREYQEYKSNANLEEKSWEYTFEKWYGRTYNDKSKI
jgi:hypothetical protein